MDTLEQIEARFSEIRELIEKEEWQAAHYKIEIIRNKFKWDNNEIATKICDAFDKFFSVLSSSMEDSSAAIKNLETALNMLPEGSFGNERSLIQYHLGKLYLGKGSDKKAVKFFKNSWENLRYTNNTILRREFLDNFIPLLIQKNDYSSLVIYFKEKLLLLNTETEETEYIKTLILLITYLLQDKKIDDALYFYNKLKLYSSVPGLQTIKESLDSQIGDFIESSIKSHRYSEAIQFLRVNKLTLTPYLIKFQKLFDNFKKKPSLELAKYLIDLNSFESESVVIQNVLRNWNQEIFPIINDLIIKDPQALVTHEDFKPIIKFLLKDSETALKFTHDLSSITETLVENPDNKDIMALFLFLNETLHDLGFNSTSAIVHSWISQTLLFRSLSQKSGSRPGDVNVVELIQQSLPRNAPFRVGEVKFNEKLIFLIFNNTQGTFAPLSLIKRYFEDAYQKNYNTANVPLCNQLSEFLGDLSEIVYGFQDSPLKEKIIKTINNYTLTVASGYEFIILKRMKAQNIDNITGSTASMPRTVVDSIIDQLSIKNPLPITRCLAHTAARWRSFPTLEKTSWVGYNQYRTTAIKSIFWMLLFSLLFPAHFESTYQRLVKNEELQHKNLIEIIKAWIDFHYYFQQCMKADNSVPYRMWKEIPDHVINLLKKTTDRVKYSEEELRDIILTSLWKSESQRMLDQVIEFKNFCIYCSYNMPPGSKTCPNCGREVKKEAFEAPSIDFSAMGSFFDHK